MVKGAKDKKHAKSKSKINEGLDIFRKEKQILWHIDLGKYSGIPHQGGHALTGRFIKVGEHKVTAKQIGRIVRRIPPKKLGEYKPHNKQHQQRREYAPRHTQYRAFVFSFKIPLYQLFKKELVLPYLLNNHHLSVKKPCGAVSPPFFCFPLPQPSFQPFDKTGTFFGG